MKNFIKNIQKINNARSVPTILFLLTLTFFTWLQWSPYFPDPDSFYHIKIAQLMRESHGFVTEFKWLPLTILPDIYADQAWLYHILLIPFTYFPNPLIGLKVATAIFATAAIMAIYWFLRRSNVKYAWIYIIALLLTNPFIFRISLAKASALAVTTLIIGLYFLLKTNKSTYPLALVSVLYVWLHGSWPLLIIASLIYWTVSGIFNFHKKIKQNKPKNLDSATKQIISIIRSIASCPERKFALAAITGALAGLIINPYFPQNLKFFWYQTVIIAAGNYKNIIGVGSEWYGFSLHKLIGYSVFIAIFTLISLIIFLITIKKQTRAAWTLLIFSAFLFLITLRSRRNSEYFIPAVVIFSAITLSQTPQTLWYEIKRLLSRLSQYPHDTKESKTQILTKLLIIYLIITVPFILVRDTIRIKSALSGRFTITKYQAATAWLSENIPPNSRLIHTAWEDFPILFYNAPDFRYIVGLDPRFLYISNPDTYQYWLNLVEGKEKINKKKMQKILGSTTLLIEKTHTALKEKFQKNPSWKLAYEDKEVWIMQDLTQKP